MTANFNDAAVLDVFTRIESFAMQSGRFESVNMHEPKTGPGVNISCSIWVQAITPIGRASGLAAGSGYLVLNERIYKDFLSQPPDYIDPEITAATMDAMGTLAGDFSLGGADGVRTLDVFGMYGQMMSAAAGYVELNKKFYRVMTLTIPIVINDMFVIAP